MVVQLGSCQCADILTVQRKKKTLASEAVDIDSHSGRTPDQPTSQRANFDSTIISPDERHSSR